MAFCRECGTQQKSNNAIICLNCGSAIQGTSLVNANIPWSGSKLMTYLFLAFLLPIVGLIVGTYGIFNESNRGKGLIIILFSIFSWAFWTAILLA
jgi:hypothetical protein